jgi:hypothetical protein
MTCSLHKVSISPPFVDSEVSDCVWIVTGRIQFILELPDQKARVFLVQSFSRSGFPNAPTRCSVKFLRGLELIFAPIFIASLARSLTSIDLCFRCGY